MIPVADLEHLLRRTEFVSRPARVDALSALSLEEAVEDILRVELNPSDAVDPPTFVDSAGKITIRADVLVNWWLDRMVSVPRPIAERMTLFWHGHFTSSLEKVPRPFMLLAQNRTYRRMGLGDYLDLAQAMAVEPAMLDYLDNRKNVKANPNENFSRELMELFLLGVGNFAEVDVQAMARAWTGHTVSPNTGQYFFNPTTHDYGAKTLFGVTRLWDGPETIDFIIRDDANLRMTAARFICRKMWEYLAYPAPSSTLVDQLAMEFIAGNRSIRLLVRSILLRPEFYSDSAKSALVRSPIDFVVAAISASGASVGDVNPAWRMEGMGQTPFNPPNVSGWRQNSYWINPSAWSARMSFASSIARRMVASGRFSGVGLSPEAAVDKAADKARVMLNSSTRSVLADLVRAERTRMPNGGEVENTSLMGAVLNSPEFHLQ